MRNYLFDYRNGLARPHRIILLQVQMFVNKQNTNPSIFHNISLPKPINPQVKSTSTRCISVAKGDYKKSQGNAMQMTKPSSPPAPPKQLTYYLGKGNNEGLVRRVMGNRATWVESDDSTSSFISMKWQQDQKGMKYEWLVDSGMYRGVVNQFQFHEVISNKEMLFRHLEHYCQKNGIDVWKIVPPTYLINAKDECNMQMLKQFTSTYERNYPTKLKQKTGGQSEGDIQQSKQKLKRIFCNSNLKKILAKAPPIGSHFLDEEGEYLWIVKPTFLNRGRGIQVFSKLQTLLKYISDNINGYVQKSLSKQIEEEPHPKAVDYIKRNSQQIQQSVLYRDPANRDNQNYRERREEVVFDGNQYIRVIPKGPAIIKTDRFLIQKYLEKPMLILNRKFDIRMWVLVTYNLKGYVFKQGYLRLSSMEYSCTDSPTNNTFMHLTNNAVQKFSEGYGSLADGNQLSFKHLKDQMTKLNFSFQQCLDRIHQHMRVSLKATTKLMNPMNRKFSYQIFGYDFMIDESGYPWLIEVNNNPCIEQSSKLLAMLLPRMLDDSFKLTVDPLFYGSVSSAKYKVDGYADNQNMWTNLNIEPK